MLFDEKKDMIEALLFLKGEEGLSENFLATCFNIDKSYARQLLENFVIWYNKRNGAVLVKKYGTTYKMVVKNSIYDSVKDIIVSKNLAKLSKASLETLAIIAYNQPITKIEIDKIRKVSSDSILYSLLDKELIVSNKTLDTIGKPKLYETTDLFLDVFGLESLEDLPQGEENLTEELQQFLND